MDNIDNDSHSDSGSLPKAAAGALPSESAGTKEVQSETLDARGLACPEPLMLVRNAVRALVPGAALQVLATDPTTTRDLVNFCRFMGHTMEQNEAVGDEFHYRIRKGAA